MPPRRNGNKSNWVQEVVAKMQRKGTVGSFTRQAKAHHKSVPVYTREVINKYSDGKWKKASNPKNALHLYRQAVLARTFEKMKK